MKKCLFSLLALVLGIGMLHANPVSETTAKMVGQQFVQNSMGIVNDLTLVSTATTERGVPCYYIYNIGKEGFVIISADDYFRPIIGYSNEGPFDETNPGLAYYLRTIQSGHSKNTGTPSPEVDAEWNRVLSEGRLISRNGGRDASFICTTKWNQNYPYNALCPEYAGGSGGHFYAGCVATSMSQVMKRWDYPTQGTGSHTYTSQAHPYTSQHPVNIPAITLTANFGATTYDWANMPDRVTSSSAQAEINAVATLMFHCAVAVDMDWDYDGSGSNSDLASHRISQFFGYTNAAVYQRRANFSATVWAQKVKESIDMGWPLSYSGVEEGEPYGHAFVLDGYDDNDMYHFNYGWSGSGDGWFTFENQDFHVNDGAIFNFVPAPVYNNTAQAPTNLTVTPESETGLSATLTWTNPGNSMSGAALSSIDYIVIMRGNEVVTTIDNPTPGAAMTYVDNDVPRYDYFQYHLYAVTSGNHGKVVHSNTIGFGPTCNWTVMMTSNNAQGWRGGYISVHNAAGSLIRTLTTTSSSPSSIAVSMPIGRSYFEWHAPTDEISQMNIIIKDASNTTVYTYAGSSADLPEGVFTTVNNGCGEIIGSGTPSNLVAVRDETATSNINVSWDGVDEEGYGYNIYRDGLLLRTVPNATSFIDRNAPDGGHCYYAVFLSKGGENPGKSNESCANAGDGCNPPTNLDYEITNNMFRIKLMWEKPEVTTGLSGFYIYRRPEGGEWDRIKTTGSSVTNYTDNTLVDEGVYDYKVIAYYHSIECYSAPANVAGEDNQYFLRVYYSPTGVDEATATAVNLFPNPAKDSFTIEAEELRSVTVYNTLGQVVLSNACEGNSAVINLSNVETGMYIVKVLTANGDFVKKISVVK
ncbi:MAG: C10 family peptidase [Bacteroidales bacterium]|nr:C10 family peptidase [Bacteroidales bacterium]